MRVKNKSKEDYLEAILLAMRNCEQIHQIDIARKLNVSQPATQKAIRLLILDGYIEMNGLHITLTQKGKEEAELIYDKHCTLLKFLTSLGVKEDIADVDACEIEHVISEQTYAAIKRHLQEHIIKNK